MLTAYVELLVIKVLLECNDLLFHKANVVFKVFLEMMVIVVNEVNVVKEVNVEKRAFKVTIRIFKVYWLIISRFN